jgi:hypothetical protein
MTPSLKCGVDFEGKVEIFYAKVTITEVGCNLLA